MKATPADALIGAVVRVGNGGRGFVIKAPGYAFPDEDRLIITAAHCLPQLPPAHPWMHLEEKTYCRLIGALGDELTLWAECIFADPICDIAILAGPDNQAVPDAADAFNEFIGSLQEVLPVRAPSTQNQRGWLLTLDRTWAPCRLAKHGRALWITESAGIEGGMSGSPILDDEANAIGVVSTSAGTEAEDNTKGGLEPCLSEVLPAWLTRSLNV